MQSSKFTVQPATKQHLQSIDRLIRFFSFKNSLLPKQPEEIEREISSFLVVPIPDSLHEAVRLDSSESAGPNMSAEASSRRPDPPPVSGEPNPETPAGRAPLMLDPAVDVAGIIALKKFNPQLIEVRSFAVWPRFQGSGVGGLLLKEALKRSPSGKLFTLTFIPGYFERYGFKRVEKASLPEKIYVDCLRCPNLRDCNEVPLVFLKNN